MYSFDAMNHGWGMGLGMVAMLLIVLLAVVGGFSLLKWLMGSSAGESVGRSENAEACLKARYAKGEIDKDSYLQQLEEIRK